MTTSENSAFPIVIYQKADGSIATEVRLEGELRREAAIRNFRIARQEGQRQVERTLRKLCKRPITVMPAKASIQNRTDLSGAFKPWLPAFAGMTGFCRPFLTPFQKNLIDQASLPEARELERSPPFKKRRLGGIYVHMLAQHEL